jgi:hypothetical protein
VQQQGEQARAELDAAKEEMSQLADQRDAIQQRYARWIGEC